MLGDITVADEIYIVTGHTDMRKSIDGLCAVIEEATKNGFSKKCSLLFWRKALPKSNSMALLWETDGFVPFSIREWKCRGRFPLATKQSGSQTA